MPDEETTAREAYDGLLDALRALPQEKVRKPNRRVLDHVLDGQHLAVTAEADRELLEKLAAADFFENACLDQLEQRALALRHAQSCWVVIFDPTNDPEVRDKLERAENVRGFLLEDLDYLGDRFERSGRDDDAGQLRRTLSHVREGSGRSDMLADLSDLSHLADRHAGGLATVGHDATLGPEADALATELGRVLDPSRPEVKEALDLRNRAYTLLRAAVIEVRKTGEWLHRYAPERRAEYAPLPAQPKRPKPK